MFLTISNFSYRIAILMIIKNNDKTTKLALIVLLLVVFFNSGLQKGLIISLFRSWRECGVYNCNYDGN